MAAPAAGGIQPAQLGFLAIFNPSLGNTDDTIDDQIVYYTSVTSQASQRRSRPRRSRGRPTQDVSPEERHERLRQIGLAQGMASFSRDFANGAAVDTIDTDKTRVLLHELEPGWWLLVSIDLNKVSLPPRLPTKSGEGQEERFEYSTKEMKPGSLLLRDLLRAHSIFLMHHDTSLSALFVRSKRSKFVAVLSRYWDLFLSTWSVMLHGNPTRGVFGGINIAACGELGMGVGEEERGSGEREVLEGLVGRIEGLVDLVVSRFGPDEDGEDSSHAQKDNPRSWLGTGKDPATEDGAIFLGIGALSRKSLRDVTHWMEDLFTWGEHAYGVIDSPTSLRRGKIKRADVADEAEQSGHPEPGGAAPGSTRGTQTVQGASPPEGQDTKEQRDDAPPKDGEDEGKLDKMVGYLKMGYGTHWSLPSGFNQSSTEPTNTQPDAKAAADKETTATMRPQLPKRASSFDSSGHYLIGLKGEIEEANTEYEGGYDSGDPDSEHNSRTVLRTVNLELESEAVGRPEATIVRDFQHPASILTQSQVVGNMLPGYDSHDLNKAKKLRVVVYVNRPFIFTFFFNLRTDSLAWDTLYRSLHYQLAPLRKPLLASTKYRPEKPDVGHSASSIYDLVWDPKALTVHSTIPNIPEQWAPQDSWSRADALSTHLNLLSIHSATRARAADLERTQKTNRGWWIVWTSLLERAGTAGDTSASLSTIHESGDDNDWDVPGGKASEREDGRAVGKEIFLLRRASDHIGFRESSGGSDGAGRLAQGIGVDTRRYVEELLGLL